MRFGICTAIDNIEKVEKMGFDYLEANASGIAALSEEEFQKTLELVKNAKIGCECFNVLFPKTISVVGPDKNAEEMEKYLHGVFSRIQKLGGTIVVFGSGKCRSFPEGMDFDEAFRQLVDSFRLVGKIAAEYGITIVIEPLNRAESNLINSVAEGALLRAILDMPSVQLLADGYHMFLEDEKLSDISRVRKLAHTHIAVREGRGYPLAEDEDLKGFFAQLKAIGYEDRISIEGSTKDFDEEAPKALAVLKKLAAG